MSLFLIAAIRRDRRGEVSHVHWGKVDPETNTWLEEPSDAPVEDVIGALDSGDDVYTLHLVDGMAVPPGRPVIRKVLANGTETIQGAPASPEDVDQRGLEDLPEF